MIVKDIAEYEESDSELAKSTIATLHQLLNEAEEYIQYWQQRTGDYMNKCDKAKEYIDFVWNNTQMQTNTVVALRTLENILRDEYDE